MKELGDIGELNLSNRLNDLEAMWSACVSNGDVVYIGTPYDLDPAPLSGGKGHYGSVAWA
jgi:hypothetical protein